MMDRANAATPARTTPGTDPRWWRLAVLVIAATALVRVILAAIVPLFPDETYYWEWSRRLAAGYFDHPPGIALLIAGGTALLGDTPLGVRLLSVLGGAVAAWGIALLARRLAGDRAAFHAALILACLPLAATGLVLATPDAPLLTFGALGLLAVERAISAPPRSARSLQWWIVAGLALGAAFVAKYMAVLLPMGVVIAFALHPGLRQHLREPGPYVASAIALLIFAPVVWWNATHDWVSFRFQLGHGFGGSPPRGSAIGRLGELVGGQLGLATPILFTLMAIAVVAALRRRFGDARHFLLGVIAATVMLFFAVSALRKPVEANWPAATYLAAVPLLAVVAAAGWWRRWVAAGYALGGALVLLTWIHAVTPVLPVQARRDPVARAHGWSTLAAAANDAAVRARQEGRRVHIAADRYQDASELAFHLPGGAHVPALNLGGRRNQYDLWPGFPAYAREGDDIVLALGEIEELHPTIARLQPHFESAEQLDLVQLRRGDGVVTQRRLWRLRGWRGSWPVEHDER